MKNLYEKINIIYKDDKYINIIYNESLNQIQININYRYSSEDLIIMIENENINIYNIYYDEEENEEKNIIIFSINQIIYDLNNQILLDDIIIHFIRDFMKIIDE